jgi:hypothetical protein
MPLHTYMHIHVHRGLILGMDLMVASDVIETLCGQVGVVCSMYAYLYSCSCTNFFWGGQGWIVCSMYAYLYSCSCTNFFWDGQDRIVLLYVQMYIFFLVHKGAVRLECMLLMVCAHVCHHILCLCSWMTKSSRYFVIFYSWAYVCACIRHMQCVFVPKWRNIHVLQRDPKLHSSCVHTYISCCTENHLVLHGYACYVSSCMRFYMWNRDLAEKYIFIHVHTQISIIHVTTLFRTTVHVMWIFTTYQRVCVCVCVCVCVESWLDWEGARTRPKYRAYIRKNKTMGLLCVSWTRSWLRLKVKRNTSHVSRVRLYKHK